MIQHKLHRLGTVQNNYSAQTQTPTVFILLKVGSVIDRDFRVLKLVKS